MAAPRVQSSDQERYALVLSRLLACEDARDNLITFTRLMNPTPQAPDDPAQSLYQDEKFHRAMAAALEELAKGTYPRLIINLPPRHGKTQLATKSFIPWYSGRHPADSIIFGTYNEKFALDIGRAVRDVFLHPAYAQVFPEVTLRGDSQAADRLQTSANGVLAFVGRGGTTTGRGGDLLVVDDPAKDRKEADSPTIRDSMWTWFTQIIGTRMMSDQARILLIQTRWHEDDIVGRLTDPRNDYYDEDICAKWKVIDLPAMARENDVLGRKPGEPLWPSRFGRAFLEDQRKQDARGFSALYQGRPSPAQGAFFKADWITEYKKNELPKNLRIYAASDHAVSVQQGRDKTALVLVGVDESGIIWVLPQSQHRQMDASSAVESMLGLIQAHKPLFWWAEKGQISKAIGPFLRKRMIEEHIHAPIIEITPSADKQTRAQSFHGRLSMGQVRFPGFAHWWGEVRDQILKFPYDSHDDFVDALAYIGLGMQQQTRPGVAPKARGPRAGTFGELLEQRKAAERLAKYNRNGGW